MEAELCVCVLGGSGGCFLMCGKTTARVWLLEFYNRLRNDRLLTAGLFVKKKQQQTTAALPPTPPQPSPKDRNPHAFQS